MADNGWKRKFDDPIPLPRGRQLVTLEDAGRYVTKLPKAEHKAPEWQAAMEALILVATRGGPTMLARIGVMRALNRHVERAFTNRKRPPLGKAQAGARSIISAHACPLLLAQRTQVGHRGTSEKCQSGG
jgi:hypothetical protein